MALDAPTATVIAACIGATTTISAAILGYWTRGRASQVNVLAGIEALINSSDVPMYFTDTALRILFCNDAFVELLDCDRSGLVGTDVAKVTKDFSLPLIPEPLRPKAEEHQRSLRDKVLGDMAPHSEAVVYFDCRHVSGGRYRSIYRIWVHADKTKATPTGKPVGLLVLLHVEEISERTLNAEIAKTGRKE